MYSIALIFFAVLAVIITNVVIPLLQSKTNAEDMAAVINWVKIAVAAAEQVYTGTGRGKEKKAYVLDWLESKGIHLDDSVIDALIESAVYELKNYSTPAVPKENPAVKDPTAE